MKKTACILIVVLLCFVGISHAKVYDITFGWNRNTESDLAGYKLYQRTNSGSYNIPVKDDIQADANSYTLNVDIIEKTYFVLTAFDTSGNESDYSNEVNFIPDLIAPSPPQGFSIKSISIIIDF